MQSNDANANTTCRDDRAPTADVLGTDPHQMKTTRLLRSRKCNVTVLVYIMEMENNRPKSCHLSGVVSTLCKGKLMTTTYPRRQP
jgi:hypothetical protein